jgi:DNA-binding PadR family transcriptional regulator
MQEKTMTFISTKALILQALCWKEMYGFEIFNHYIKRTKGGLRINQGALYPGLEILTAEGLIEVSRIEKTGPLCRGGRPARLYKLTEAGRQQALKNRLLLKNLFFPPESNA